jgi:transglutaminase-like putative cysteine protease
MRSTRLAFALFCVVGIVALCPTTPLPRAQAADRVALDDAVVKTWFGEHWYVLQRGEYRVGWMRRALTRDKWKGYDVVVRDAEYFVNVAGDGNALKSRTRTYFRAEGTQRLVAAISRREAQGKVTTRRVVREDDRFDVTTERSSGTTTGAVKAVDAFLVNELGLERLAKAWKFAPSTSKEQRLEVYGVNLDSLSRTRQVLRLQRSEQTAETAARGELVVRTGDGAKAWSEPLHIDPRGAIVKGALFSGITVRRASKDEALETTTMHSMRQASLVPVAGTPGDLATVERIQFTARAGAEKLFPSVGRQSVERLEDGRVRITVERDLAPQTVVIGEMPASLASTALMDFGHPTVRRALQAALRGTSTRAGQVQRLLDYVRKRVEYMVILGDVPASATLASKRGDCTESARLLAAFCRGAKIPARLVRGLIWSSLDQKDGRGYFGWHAWVEVGLKGIWREVDPTSGTMPAHAVRLRVAADVTDVTALDDLDLRIEKVVRAANKDE